MLLEDFLCEGCGKHGCLLKISAVVVPEHPGNHLGTARLLLAASFDRPMLYSLVGLLRNADDEDDDEEG